MTSAATSPRLLTASDLSERWSVTTSQVHRLARAGRLPTVWVGRYQRFRLAAVEAWEVEHEDTGAWQPSKRGRVG